VEIQHPVRDYDTYLPSNQLVDLTTKLVSVSSTVSTILKYRCGIIPSLGSENFQPKRVGVDMAYMNTANAVYGLIGAFGLFFVIVGLVIFLFIWDFSRNLMLTLLAWGIGLTITILMKMIITRLCRRQFYRAFYRCVVPPNHFAGCEYSTAPNHFAQIFPCSDPHFFAFL
jgi:hypothetical protein